MGAINGCFLDVASVAQSLSIIQCIASPQSYRVNVINLDSVCRATFDAAKTITRLYSSFLLPRKIMVTAYTIIGGALRCIGTDTRTKACLARRRRLESISAAFAGSCFCLDRSCICAFLGAVTFELTFSAGHISLPTKIALTWGCGYLALLVALLRTVMPSQPRWGTRKDTSAVSTSFFVLLYSFLVLILRCTLWATETFMMVRRAEYIAAMRAWNWLVLLPSKIMAVPRAIFNRLSTITVEQFSAMRTGVGRHMRFSFAGFAYRKRGQAAKQAVHPVNYAGLVHVPIIPHSW